MEQSNIIIQSFQTASEEFVNKYKRMENYILVLEELVSSSWLKSKIPEDCYAEFLERTNEVFQSHPEILEDGERIMREQESRANAVD